MRTFLFVAALTTAGSAHSQTLDPSEIARFAASREVCEIEIAEERVEEWLKANAPKLDLNWLRTYRAESRNVRLELPDLTPEQVAVHCVRIRDIARAMGFLE